MVLSGQKTALGAAQEEPTTGSVFDFLYYDNARISSFLSQFDNFGHLTSITHGERAHRSKNTSVKSQIDGSAYVVKGSTATQTDTSSEYGEDSHRTYDPRWANALFFLDYLDQHKLLQRNITEANIGQIVIFSGELALFDMGLLKGLWGLPSVKRAMLQGAEEDGASGNRHDRRKGATQKKPPKSDREQAIEMATDMLSVLPHSVQTSISNDDGSTWSTLKEDCLTVSASDLFMKHGMTISGSWNVVGILDARPQDEEFADLDAFNQLNAGITLGGMATMLVPHLIPAIRPLLGRPGSSFGLTPLLLFREVGPENNSVSEIS